MDFKIGDRVRFGEGIYIGTVIDFSVNGCLLIVKWDDSFYKRKYFPWELLHFEYEDFEYKIKDRMP